MEWDPLSLGFDYGEDLYDKDSCNNEAGGTFVPEEEPVRDARIISAAWRPASLLTLGGCAHRPISEPARSATNPSNTSLFAGVGKDQFVIDN